MTDTATRTQKPDASFRADPLIGRDWLWALGAAAIAVVAGAIAAFMGTHFFYVGDNPESFIPLWHHFGELLRDGKWWTVEASSWMGGNYVGEAAYAQWNPLLLLAYVVVSLFTNLSLGASVIMIAMLGLLAAGSFLLMRSYGAGRWPSLAMATALPVTGFTLFYEAAGWPMGLAALIGFVFFWTALRQQVKGEWPVVVTWVFGALAVTTGNPYIVVFIVILLAVFFCEEVIRKNWRAVVDLVVAGALTGLVVILVFLPFLGAQPVSVRQELAGIYNDTFMVPGLGDLIASGTSSYLPEITNWGFAHVELLPSSYLAWFALPLLVWIRWGSLWHVLRERITIVVVGAIFFLMVLGPSNLWLFRWPVRLIEYFYLVVLLVLALGITVGLANTHRKARVWASGAIVAFGTYLAMMMTPDGMKIHAVGFLLTAVLLIVVYQLWRRKGMNIAMVAVIVGTLATTGFQTAVYPRGEMLVPAYNIDMIREQAANYEGTVLQLASQGLTDAEQVRSGKILYGNLFVATGHETINRYSGISFRAFTDELCMDYKGQTCPEAYDRLFRKVAGSDDDLIDVLGIGTLIIQRALLPDVTADGPPAGWKEVENNDIRVVWVREEPLPANGRITGTSPGVIATSTQSTETAEKVDVTAESAGSITFARLAWPGYRATVNGEAVKTTTTVEGLLQVDVPAGASTVELSFTAPGLTLGAIATVASGLIALGYSVMWWILGRRKSQSKTGA